MRPSRDNTFLEIASVMARRGTCCRRQVGAVLVNKRGHVLATGYNGPAAGQPHCIDEPCPGAHYPSGEGLDKCVALHAEANALLQCRDVYDIHAAYVTHSPCVHCVKLLMNTSCKEIIFANRYAHDSESMLLWESSRERNWIHSEWLVSEKTST